MNPNHSQARSNIENYQYNRLPNIALYSDDIERIGNSTTSNTNDYNVAASEEQSSFGESYNNVQGSVYQESQTHVDNSHFDIGRVYPALNVVDSTEKQISNFGHWQNYNVQVPVAHQQSQTYVDNSHLNIKSTEDALNMNNYDVTGSTEQNSSGHYQDYYARAPVYQQSQSYFNIERVNVNLTDPVKQISNDNFQNHSPIHQQSRLYTDDNIVDQQILRRSFVFNPINDPCAYNVKCEEISSNSVIKMLNESLINNENIRFNENNFIFFHIHQYNNKLYQVTCRIVPSLSINKNNYGIEIRPNLERESLDLTLEQRQNLVTRLSQYLDAYLH
ncbi:hypothetical protein RclHR1_23450001 [Rhizophagus clarus]|uniref:Uncharacterized protein n=1 Tax=Rhizophagus clarus TaxID=94130 RepID=A0A2Z6RQB4_9GLOM|nr:hypothetical protein RclHR1_23450001 [Rhizophagus clarus]GES73796.1 hypothetical protein GLOIN_2v432227 [Rhizophagus clarus]